MAYATAQDLVDAFGEDEIVRVTTPDGAELGAIDAVQAARALDEASDTMDSYLRRRYVVPVQVAGTVPLVLRRCCCDLARKFLRMGGNREPSTQVIEAAKRQTDWLQNLALGHVTLDGAVPAGPLSGARTSDRRVPFHAGDRLGHGGGGEW